jgi:nucleoside-diphosphate-sugar epimerase
MNVLLIGGTGLISVGIVKHLLARGARVTMLNRGKRPNVLPPDVEAIEGDRNDRAVVEGAAARKFDVVIDMFCFNPEQASAAIEAFSGRTGHYVFCSTVCTYGVKVPGLVLVDETFPQEPISGYGRNKLACEKLVLEANASGKLPSTIIRPSHTYGPGSPLIDQLEPDPVAWDRIEKGRPIMLAGDGLGLWVSTHRDDCGALFSLAAGEKRAFGECYNATRDEQFTWLDYTRTVARALGRKAHVLFMPASWIGAQDPSRFGLLREITAFHGAYSSAKAKRAFPTWSCPTDFATGAAETLADTRARSAWRTSDNDHLYNQMVSQALEAGVVPVEVG